MQASHSMQRSAVNTVCKSQFKQRSTSVTNCSALNPSVRRATERPSG
jgi:hypothetical protein